MSPKNTKQIKYILANIAVITVTVLWLLPIIWMFLNSFRSSSEPFYSGILPSFYTLDNYIDSLFDEAFMKAFRNSLIVAGSSAVLVVILAGLAAYGFSRYRFRGQNITQVLLLVIRLFPAILLAITLFQVAGFLNVYDTFVPLIIVNAVINLPFAIWNLKTTFDALPIELEEASWLDGLSRVGGIFRILLPLMAPSIVATMAFVFLLNWNEYLFAVSFIRSPGKQLITVAIASNVGQYHIDFVGLLANGMLASLPLLFIFIWMQKYIVSGLGAGAIRG